MQAYGFQRETNLTDFEFGMITDAVNLDTLYDGFVGLAPYEGQKGDKNANFLYQL